QHGGGRIERERSVRLDARIVPALLFLEVGDEHVVGEDGAERQILVLRLVLLVRRLRDPDRGGPDCSPSPSLQKLSAPGLAPTTAGTRRRSRRGSRNPSPYRPAPA